MRIILLHVLDDECHDLAVVAALSAGRATCRANEPARITVNFVRRHGEPFAGKILIHTDRAHQRQAAGKLIECFSNRDWLLLGPLLLLCC